VESVKTLDLSPIKFGTFEWIYTAYPASVIDGMPVSEVRKKMGGLLMKRYPVEADVVSPVPNSGRWHAIGTQYAKGFNLPYEEVFVRYDYSDRSYTQEEQEDRDQEGSIKLIPVESSIRGKKIIIVDDSIVRGTQTLNQVDRLINEFGAKEVHARIACPPLMHACSYGKTTKEDKDCIARRMSIEDIQKKLLLNSLGYATVDDLEKAIGMPRSKLCLECWVD
jgi:amidophosphoribosyltransferase